MERQRSFSLKSTRFVVFSFTITSSIIFLTFFSFRVIKFTPFINQETHFQLSKPAVNVSLKPLTVQTLTGSRRNFTAPNAKNLILIDTPVNKLDKTSGFSNLSVSGDIQKEKNDTQAPIDEASKGDGLNVTSLSRGEESVPAPSLIEVQSNERLQEKKIGAASVEKIELPIEYYVSHFLVHEGKARVGQKRVQTLRIDSIDHGSSRWRGADILIFNTAHWWSHYKTKAGINYYQEGDQVLPRLDVSTAFKRALMTWASWVDKRINPRKTQIFFRNSAPSHFRGGQWNAGGHCAEATQPLNEISGFSYPEKNVIIEDVIKQMRTPVTLLNITSLSEYRIDGHPSTYGRNKRYSSNIQDCSHWCLPGVPDTWNELLYFQLQSKKE
ncbi:hypothetical protein CUMW_056760 [Citrus unshiu]|nr:hypothetical protein CUMW_056760 [Citrus unshiu]